MSVEELKADLAQVELELEKAAAHYSALIGTKNYILQKIAQREQPTTGDKNGL